MEVFFLASYKCMTCRMDMWKEWRKRSSRNESVTQGVALSGAAQLILASLIADHPPMILLCRLQKRDAEPDTRLETRLSAKADPLSGDGAGSNRSTRLQFTTQHLSMLRNFVCTKRRAEDSQ